MLAHRMQLWRTTNAAVAIQSVAGRWGTQVSGEAVEISRLSVT